MSADEPGTPPPAVPGAGPRRRRRRRGRRKEGGPAQPGSDPSSEPAAARSRPALSAPPPAGRPRQGDAPPPSARDGRGRRGRRGRRGTDGEDTGPRAPEKTAPVIPAVSHLAESGPTSEPLSDEEVREMKEHLAFLREHKDALRLRLNAAEDLLVNGRREPNDRGVCRHLLHKVDRSVIEAAVGREPLKSNVLARSHMLAGAIRLTADVSVLLAYLETLASQRSQAEAAQAFAEVVRRIDFESLSAPRLARLLQVLTETFQGQDRVQVLFGLLDGAAFRRAFDAAESVLPAEVAAAFAPLRAVHRRLLGEPSGGAAGDRLALGLEQVMAAPDPVLRGYPEPLRVRMLELALDPGIPPALADRAAGVLLTSLVKTGRTFTRLAMRRASQLLARHVDDRARATLDEVRRAAPGFHGAERSLAAVNRSLAAVNRWLAALDARRMGRVALTASPPARGRLAAGFWLDGQRPVWLRTVAVTDGARLETEAALQTDLALPGVAPVVEHGVASGIPYVAVLAHGQPWTHRSGNDHGSALAFAAQVARILHALALAGVALPDAEPERFCITGDRTPTLVLADLDGAQRATSSEAAEVNATSAAALVRRLVPTLALPTDATRDLITLVRTLDAALLTQRD